MYVQPVSIGIEFPEVTVQPVSIANRNLIKQVGFRFLDFTFDSDLLMIISVAENMCAPT